jgi:hypothetical protein
MVNNSNAETVLCQTMITRTLPNESFGFFQEGESGYRERRNYEEADNGDFDCSAAERSSGQKSSLRTLNTYARRLGYLG